MASKRWIRVDVDWDDSEWLFFGSALVSLAWVRLLCFVAKRGSAGACRADETALVGDGKIPLAKFREMIDLAQHAGDLSVRNGLWIVADWDRFVVPYRKHPRGWSRLRARILKRDGWVCRYCGGFADSVDHVVPVAQGGSDASSNLAAACMDCNRSKRDRTPAEWLGGDA